MRRHHFSALALFLVTASPAAAQISFTGTTYTQNFDTLASAGNNVPWVNNVTLLGWYSNRTTYRASQGGSNSGDLYSFGDNGAHSEDERALGSEATDATGVIVYGFQLRNDSGAVITDVRVTYTGEQWRRSGGTPEDQTLLVDYLITASALNQITAGGYTAAPFLNFSNPVNGTPSGKLDGNLPENQTLISGDLTGLLWNPGEFLWIRFTNPINPNGSNNNLAIDDLSVAVVPEPATLVALGGVGLALGWWYRKGGKRRAVALRAANRQFVRAHGA